ncbi:methylglyoxal synthase [Chryseobacterium polytrichastri]|uniref:Methylglyoxal synthase n=1 Tax=Chryseobacterium polytrichastri TaxID=1302687 RepID=A0A1M7KUH5_9FLAO|nr:methylglyoxal synthase [Chryseobacterium polytrichastri]SHM69236.1 methylglyoxal synthase [Chryseobacterium polytrichastri]
MKRQKILGIKKSIALLAHDNKKNELIKWTCLNRDRLIYHRLIATETTGKLIEEQLQTKIKKVMSGPLGGDQQLGAMLSQGKIDIIIFFWDPMETQPHDSDVKALLRLCVVWNIPMACDTATADFIITSPLMTEQYIADHPTYKTYVNRNITK